jgi:hypothetical protein
VRGVGVMIGVKCDVFMFSIARELAVLKNNARKMNAEARKDKKLNRRQFFVASQ